MCAHMSRAEVSLSGERKKCHTIINSKKVDSIENADCWYMENWDDHSSNKKPYF